MMDAHQQSPQQQITQMSYEAAPSSSSLSSRPTLGFPLGTALLLIVIFCLSGMLSCCYHWDRVQSLRRRALGRNRRQRDDEENPGDGDGDGDGDGAARGIPSPPSKPGPRDQSAKQDGSKSLPVIMPGDRVPKFIAWPCPCDQVPSSVAAPPPRASEAPPQLDKLVTVEERSPPTTPPPSAAASGATTNADPLPAPEPTAPPPL